MRKTFYLGVLLVLLFSTTLVASISKTDAVKTENVEQTEEMGLVNLTTESNVAELYNYLQTTKTGGTVRHPNLKNGSNWAGTIKFLLQGTETWVYCVDLFTDWCVGKTHKYASDLAQQEIYWVLNNFYPTNLNEPAELSTTQKRAQAVQLVVWHFVDGIDISSGGTPIDVFDAARRIIAEAQTRAMIPVPAKLMVEVVNSPMWVHGEQTVTVSVFDQNGDPMSGVNVDLDITGQNIMFTTVSTDANGQGHYAYNGTTEGEDKVKAKIVFTVLPGLRWEYSDNCQGMIQAKPAAAELMVNTSFQWESFCPIELTTPQTAIWNDGDNDNITNTGQAPVDITLVWEWETLGGVRVEFLRETITLAPGLTYTVDFPSIQDWKNTGPASIVVDADPHFEIWTYKMHVTADVKMGALLEECGDQDFMWYRYFSERKSRVASLGDFVWWDFNANGIQETGETGLENVTVNLFSTSNQLLDTQTTVANGYYLFDDLLPADYVVQFVTPAGFMVSPMHQGDVGKDSDAGLNGFSLPVTLASGEVNLTIDAGFFKKLTPHVLCMSVDGDVLRAKLGYTNPNPKPITVPVGIENGFAGGSGPDMGQPNVFLPGQHDFHSQEAFMIEVPLVATLFWNLCGTTLPIDENLAFADPNLQATVGFTADIQSGIGPLTVQFQNTSTNSDDFLWDFGDGSTSSEKNPIHTYGTQQKYYTVMLTCLACGTNKHEAKDNFITVLKPSTVNFEGAPIAGNVGTEVAFYNNSGGLANVFEWDFGDGITATYQHDHTNKVHPLHQYNLPGEYAVTLKANGQGGMAELTIPGMVYIDAADDYIPLDLVTGGRVYENSGWENAIDHDVYGIGCSVVAEAEEAEAIFEIQNEAVYEVNTVRVLVESIEGAAWPTNLTTQIEILASMDGVTFVPAFSGELTGRRGEWDLFELTTPFTAKFVKINLLEARGEFAQYRELVEFQLFGQEIDETAALMRNNGTEADGLIPETFGLAQNYPNPFNPETQITFLMPVNGRVQLTVYNSYGQLIRTLVKGAMNAGVHQIKWNAVNEFNEAVASGVYVYRLLINAENGEKLNFTKAMTFVK